MLPSTHPMQNPPDGDPALIRDDFASQLQELDLSISQALLAMAMTTVLSNAWVGIRIQDVRFTVATEQDTPPSRAQMLRQGAPLSRRRPDKTQQSTTSESDAIEAAFGQAADEGWCTVMSGYAYPTQKFAAFLTAT